MAVWTTQKEYLPCDTTKSNYSNKFPIYFINYPFKCCLNSIRRKFTRNCFDFSSLKAVHKQFPVKNICTVVFIWCWDFKGFFHRMFYVWILCVKTIIFKTLSEWSEKGSWVSPYIPAGVCIGFNVFQLL